MGAKAAGLYSKLRVCLARRGELVEHVPQVDKRLFRSRQMSSSHLATYIFQYRISSRFRHANCGAAEELIGHSGVQFVEGPAQLNGKAHKNVGEPG